MTIKGRPIKHELEAGEDEIVRGIEYGTSGFTQLFAIKKVDWEAAMAEHRAAIKKMLGREGTPTVSFPEPNPGVKNG